MTEVFINDIRLDLLSNEITQTFQLGDIGDISTRQTSYTNKFKAPKTPNNIVACNYLGIVGKEHVFEANQFPYGTPSAKIIESGIELVSSGLALATETNNNFEITIYGSEKSFYEKVKDLTLQDCFPDTFFTYTAENVATAFDRNSSFVFTLLYYNNFTRTHHSFGNYNNGVSFAPYAKLWTERMTPQFFWKTLFKNIFDYLGYTVVNPIANDSRFLNLLTNASTTVMNFNVQYGQEFNFKNVAPIMNCADFIKEVMMRFGLLIRVSELHKKVEFIRMDDLITVAPVEDWSGKFSSFKKEIYKLGSYGRKNIMNHPSDTGDDIQNESVIDLYRDWADNELTGSFNIKNSQIDKEEATIFTSKFSKPELVRYTKYELVNTYGTDTPGVWEYFGAVYVGTENSNGSISNYRQYHLIDMLEFEYDGDYPYENYLTVKSVTKEFKPQVFYNYKANYGFQLRMRLPDGTFQNFGKLSINIAQYQEEYEQFINNNNIPTTTVKKPLVSFQIFLDENYPFTVKTLNKMKVVSCLMNLSVVDIYTLDFFKRKHIRQLGANFYLNKVGNYKVGKLTECELVKIPSNFDEESYYEKNSQMIGTL